VAAWLSSWLFIPGEDVLLTFTVLLFPNGRLPSPRWRPFAWVLLGAVVLASVTAAIGAIPIRTDFHVDAGGSVIDADRLGLEEFQLLPMLGALVCLYTLFRRFHRSRGDEREQIKWFMSAVALLISAFLMIMVTAFVSGQPAPWTGAVFEAAALAMPIAVGVAILKYRLYDIDIIISRTLVYGALAALITGVYVGIAVGIGALVGSGGKPNLGLSILATAIVAVGFQPARERLQVVANRLVYGKRATPYQVLSQFSSHVAGSYAADEVLPRMARVLQQGTGAEVARVWLRNTAQLHAAATSPPDDSPVVPIAMDDGTLPSLPGVTRAVEVRHQGELLGALTVTKRRGESLTPVEEKLLGDLAHQAGLVLKNVRLTADLQRRLEELRASRQRLVSAQDAERRRLERNLHDGAQQHLVALKVKLGLVEMLADKDPEKVKATLQQLKADTDEALETLRDLARGIYPPLLAEKGLATALEAQARKATVPVAIDADGIGRYPQEAEATVYFCVLEALQNVQKYAHASHGVVRLREVDGELSFEVEDDGRGFDVARAQKGAGLTNMLDRLEALDGKLVVSSSPDKGSRIHGSIGVRGLVAA
jgi:signal transduction histidine kinase